MLFLLSKKAWYIPIYMEPGVEIDISYENTTLFVFSNIQYISTLFAYNIAKPYMKPIYTNIILSIWITTSIVLSYYIIINPSDFILEILDLAYTPKEYRYELAFATFVNFTLSYLFERIAVKSFTNFWEKKKVHPKGYI